MNKQFTLRAIVIMITLGTTIIGIGASPILLQQSVSAINGTNPIPAKKQAAPIATSGDNVYIAWWTNKTGNDEVMFRASTDGGKTFGDKINLSNSTVNSERAEIGTSGKNVFVTWWETMNGKDVPMLRVSTDNGKTFGPILNLSTNGTIGSGGG
jgi:hypothetical protein